MHSVDFIAELDAPDWASMDSLQEASTTRLETVWWSGHWSWRCHFSRRWLCLGVAFPSSWWLEFKSHQEIETLYATAWAAAILVSLWWLRLRLEVWRRVCDETMDGGNFIAQSLATSLSAMQWWSWTSRMQRTSGTGIKLLPEADGQGGGESLQRTVVTSFWQWSTAWSGCGLFSSSRFSRRSWWEDMSSTDLNYTSDSCSSTTTFSNATTHRQETWADQAADASSSSCIWTCELPEPSTSATCTWSTWLGSNFGWKSSMQRMPGVKAAKTSTTGLSRGRTTVVWNPWNGCLWLRPWRKGRGSGLGTQVQVYPMEGPCFRIDDGGPSEAVWWNNWDFRLAAQYWGCGEVLHQVGYGEPISPMDPCWLCDVFYVKCYAWFCFAIWHRPHHCTGRVPLDHGLRRECNPSPQVYGGSFEEGAFYFGYPFSLPIGCWCPQQLYWTFWLFTFPMDSRWRFPPIARWFGCEQSIWWNAEAKGSGTFGFREGEGPDEVQQAEQCHDEKAYVLCGWWSSDALATTAKTWEDSWQLGWSCTSTSTRGNNALAGYWIYFDSGEDQPGSSMFKGWDFDGLPWRNSGLFSTGVSRHPSQRFQWPQLLGCLSRSSFGCQAGVESTTNWSSSPSGYEATAWQLEIGWWWSESSFGSRSHFAQADFVFSRQGEHLSSTSGRIYWKEDDLHPTSSRRWSCGYSWWRWGKDIALQMDWWDPFRTTTF